MARTALQFVALGVLIAAATVGGNALSVSKGLGQAEHGMELNGKKLFERETFGGNGRTCLTCHSKLTGTLTLADVQQIIDKADPDDRFLIHDALDDDGVGTTRVQAHATIRYTIPLPPWVTMADDPGATHVTVFRGIPSTRNTPALDPVLLHDGRAPTLQEQALGAIHDHYQNTVEPTTAQLDAIAEFQRTNAHFFSSDELKEFAAGGPPPELPPGITPAEQRGRTFLVDAPFTPPSKNGICALCHSGPMLNMVNQANQDFTGVPAGVRFFGTGVRIVNAPNNPIRTWIIDDGINPVATIESPDIGLLLDPTPPTPPPSIRPRAFFANQFKIPTLWGVKDTAPYFHDNGAKTLRDAVAHYQRFFNFTEAQDPVGSATLGGFITLTDDDVDDIVAYLKLLGPDRRDK
jgi:cytochrome c peroxidase